MMRSFAFHPPFSLALAGLDLWFLYHKSSFRGAAEKVDERSIAIRFDKLMQIEFAICSAWSRLFPFWRNIGSAACDTSDHKREPQFQQKWEQAANEKLKKRVQRGKEVLHG